MRATRPLMPSLRTAQLAAYEAVRQWADKPILVIGTHYAAPTAGRVKRARAAFRFEVRT
jgi:hypothetical protein